MSIISETVLNCNNQIKINFDGGELSSDAGLLLVKDFIEQMGFDRLFQEQFHTTDTANFRMHTDDKNLLQMIYLCIAGYFADDRADDLNLDPVVRTCLDKAKLASQPTISRFFNRMDEKTLSQLNRIYRSMRNMVYHVSGRPLLTIFDLDSTLLPAYGQQEGMAWNAHYQAEGYHPLVCYDGLTGNLIRIVLRKGTDYSCNGVKEFLRPVLEEFRSDSPITNLIVRGDSGFATPELYELCEEFGVQYAIRLKENCVLRRLAIPLEMELYKNTKYNTADHAEVYGEFQYQAGPWKKPRRVLCRIEKPAGTFEHKFTFIVTTRTDSPEMGIAF